MFVFDVMALVVLQLLDRFFLITAFFRLSVSSVIMCGEQLAMAPFAIMFHCGFIVPRDSGVLRAMVFRASCVLLYITVDVLSPNVISSLDSVILPGVSVGLSGGAFSESSHSVEMWLSGCGSFYDGSLYCVLSSVSESCSMSHIAAGVNTGCFTNLQSEAKFFTCFYDKFCLFGFVTLFERAVFGFLPKCASNVANLVTPFGISLMICNLWTWTLVPDCILVI